MIGLVFWKDASGCCVENGLEMGSHRDRSQPGDWRLPGVKTVRLKDWGGGVVRKLHRCFFLLNVGGTSLVV